MRGRLVLGTSLGAALASVISGSACGNEPTDADAAPPKDATTLDGHDAASDATLDVADDAIDDVFDAWAGCTTGNPVVCMDADYYVTINGDGPPQVLRYAIEPCQTGDAAYHVPVAQYFWPGQTPAFLNIRAATSDQCWGSGWPPDGSAGMVLYTFGPSENALSYFQTSKKENLDYDSRYSDAGPTTMTYTRYDPPGGLVAGSYSGTLREIVGPDGSAMLTLSGDFVACRICDTSLP